MMYVSPAPRANVAPQNASWTTPTAMLRLLLERRHQKYHVVSATAENQPTQSANPPNAANQTAGETPPAKSMAKTACPIATIAITPAGSPITARKPPMTSRIPAA